MTTATKGCTGKFRFDKAFHSKNRAYTKQMVEFGGNSKLDYGAMLISQKEVTSGKYDRVKIPRGVIDWHSHPAKCAKSTCTIGLPSPADLCNIYDGALRDSEYHLVYSKEGTYVIRIADHFKAAIVEHPKILPLLKERVTKDLTELQSF